MRSVKNNSLRRTAIASALAVSTATLSLLPALSASAVVSGPKAPGMLKVERTGASLSELAIAWKGVPNVDHYTVTVFNGSKDLSQVVDAKTTNLVVSAPGECTRW